MNRAGVLKSIALIEIVAAVPWHGVYLHAYHFYPARRVADPIYLLFSIEGALFIAAPIVSLVAAVQHKFWAAYTLVIFPILAFVHGISAVPYLANIAPTGLARTILLAVVNGGLIYASLKLGKQHSANAT